MLEGGLLLILAGILVQNPERQTLRRWLIGVGGVLAGIPIAYILLAIFVNLTS